MKTKIGTIALLTFTVLSLSFLLLRSTIHSIKEEALIESFNKVRPNTQQVLAGTIEVPAYKPRNKSSKSIYSGNTEGFSSFSSSESYSGGVGNDPEIFSTTAVISSNGGKSSLGHRAGYNAEKSIPSAMIALKQSKSSGSERLYASNRVSVRVEAASGLTQPFSGGGVSGPLMRMDNDDYNPPAEGAPVGEGVVILLVLSVAYGVYQRFRVKSVF